MRNEDLLHELIKVGEFKIDKEGRIWKRQGQNWKRAERQTSAGYLQVAKMRNGVRIYAGAHRLVWRHYNGPIAPGMVIHHRNGVKDDNRLENLETMTYSENTKRAFLMGLKNQDGERNPASKLTDVQVKEIRQRYAAGGVTQEQLGTEYGVSFQAISKIVRGERRPSQQGPTRDYTYRRQTRKVRRDTKGRFR